MLSHERTLNLFYPAELSNLACRSNFGFRYNDGDRSEELNYYHELGCHLVHLGDVIKDQKYKIVHRSGHEEESIVWLAEDLQ